MGNIFGRGPPGKQSSWVDPNAGTFFHLFLQKITLWLAMAIYPALFSAIISCNQGWYLSFCVLTNFFVPPPRVQCTCFYSSPR
jgi:hypothetical protein